MHMLGYTNTIHYNTSLHINHYTTINIYTLTIYTSLDTHHCTTYNTQITVHHYTTINTHPRISTLLRALVILNILIFFLWNNYKHKSLTMHTTKGNGFCSTIRYYVCIRITLGCHRILQYCTRVPWYHSTDESGCACCHGLLYNTLFGEFVSTTTYKPFLMLHHIEFHVYLSGSVTHVRECTAIPF